jgi:hypothetical protein
MRGANLLVPSAARGRILGEVDLIRWVGINEVVRFDSNLFEIEIGEIPGRKNVLVGRTVACICDLGIAAEGNVELAAAVVRCNRCDSNSRRAPPLFTIRAAPLDQPIEAPAVCVAKGLAV